ncbi:MAG: KpsF/GutQ family sugar-phosphate isomerase [Bacteroidales bacterium]|nr:KpsF/GutQ family sugar-phosphate isomerase [Bacteroidales bacterium]
MKSAEEIKNIAIQVIADEQKAIANLASRLDYNFAEAVGLLYSCKGRVVVTGIGKSANIATKIVSTLNSTGTPALFLHAADAIHGDLGMVQHDDAVICISKSGNTPEIKVLVPLIKNFGNKLVAIVGNNDSFLAREADIVLDVTVEHEACPNNLAPTSSTTAQLVMGDALAVALIECRNFTAHDFARFHPGGALGKQLYLRVSDLSLQNERPVVSPSASVSEVILEMTAKRLGCTVVEQDGRMMGIITDGDLRRMMRKHTSFDHLTAADIMSTTPKTVPAAEYAVNALEIMRSNAITQLVVVDSEGRYAGIIHLHDILREGII